MAAVASTPVPKPPSVDSTPVPKPPSKHMPGNCTGVGVDDLAQPLEAWLSALGGGCEQFCGALQAMGCSSVYDLVEEW